MCVVPSDPYIRDEKGFQETLQEAVKAAEETDALVTIGISPTFAATGYGYIRSTAVEGKAYRKVEEFVENRMRKRQGNTWRQAAMPGTAACLSGRLHHPFLL